MMNMTGLMEVWNKVTMTDWIWIGAIALMVLVPLAAWLMKCWHLAHREGPDHQPAPPTPTYYGPQGPSEPEPTPAKKRWIIPAEHAEELLGLSDQEGDLAAYKFWKKVAELFPETTEYNCSTDFETDILKPAIVEDE